MKTEMEYAKKKKKEKIVLTSLENYAFLSLKIYFKKRVDFTIRK